jgi:hypothetical protein
VVTFLNAKLTRKLIYSKALQVLKNIRLIHDVHNELMKGEAGKVGIFGVSGSADVGGGIGEVDLNINVTVTWEVTVTAGGVRLFY